jgi:flagellar protein FlgJ
MSAAPTAGLAGDVNSLAGLRARANADPKAAVREVAKQFEALFMQELMKSMRSATLASGTLDNEGSKLGTEMLDQQFATQMTGLRGGLGDAIMRQLERQMGLPVTIAPTPSAATSSALATPERLPRIPDRSAAAFVQQHTEAAQAAEARTGLPAAFMLGQAAHESGWGRKEIRNADGSPSYNLFGIKAGADWKGAVAETVTTEFVNGQAVKGTARFRAYGSYTEAFADYAKLLTSSPRYQQVLATGQDAGAFAAGLQRAGYATDPAYADKLTRVINTTLRLQRAV